MVEHNQSRLSLDEAVNVVGKAIFHDDWIVSLTERERWLLGRYMDGVKPESSSVMPGLVRYVVAGRSWAEIPTSAALVKEVDQALDRRDWREAQRERAIGWLEDHGFDFDAPCVEKEALAREMAKDFAGGTAEIAPSVLEGNRARPVTASSAKTIAKEYIDGEKSGGRNPTADGLVRYAQTNGFRSGREHLRRAFRDIMGADFRRAGRPPKIRPDNSPK
jgi:hypothetical protein